MSEERYKKENWIWQDVFCIAISEKMRAKLFVT